MHNVFQHHKAEHSRSSSATRATREQRRQLRTAARNEELHRTSLLRVSNWAQEHLDKDLAVSTVHIVLQDGAYPLIHPTAHQFRDSREDPKSIYVRQYQPASVRASNVQADFQLTHLEGLPYTPVKKLLLRDWSPGPKRFK